jgi:hypothetical protein
MGRHLIRSGTKWSQGSTDKQITQMESVGKLIRFGRKWTQLPTDNDLPKAESVSRLISKELKAYQFSNDGLARSGHWKSHRDAASRSAFHELN